MNNKNENLKINYNYPLTKIILPPHLKTNEKKLKRIINNNKNYNININEEKKRIIDFLDLYNISDK